MPSTRVYLSLGSNLEPQRHLSAAVAELQHAFGNVLVSPAYRFPAVGFDGPDFINLAVGIDTDLEVGELNTWLHQLEDRHGRRREGPRYSSRTLDVDILLYGAAVLSGADNLQVPRDELRHAFVLKPLADIAGDFHHPTQHCCISQLWKKHEEYGIAFERVALAS